MPASSRSLSQKVQRSRASSPPLPATAASTRLPSASAARHRVKDWSVG